MLLLIWPGVAATGGARPLSVKTWELETLPGCCSSVELGILSGWICSKSLKAATDKLCSGLGVIYVEPAA